jgi:uncharacterized protein
LTSTLAGIRIITVFSELGDGIGMPLRATIILGAIIIASAIVNVYLYEKTVSLEDSISRLQKTNSESTGQTTTSTDTNQSSNSQGPLTLSPISDFKNQSITAVAVRSVQVTDGFFEHVEYQGTVMEIAVDIRNGGKGLVLVDTEIPTGVDFQTSARTALKVAQSVTGVDLSTKDVIFSIRSKGNGTSNDLQAVDGPSAGAAMTVLLVSELRSSSGTSLKQNVLMTGTINPDGTIGPVGGVFEKAQAAGKYGATTFLVPTGQAVYNEQTCEKKQEGPVVFQTCRSEQKSLSDYTVKNYGMAVVEVSDVEGALKQFVS